nr:type II toxin-antitoxin system HicB family antitoxin [Candidatus Aquicultor secundus]
MKNMIKLKSERVRGEDMRLVLQVEQEVDGRWLAEIAELPGVMAYGQTPNEARAKAQALALRVIADRLEHGEESPDLQNITFAAA